MKKKKYRAAKISLILLLVTLLFLPAIQAQDPGFFLDDWQEKIAEKPDWQLIDKPTDTATVNIYVDMNQTFKKVPAYIYGNNAVTWGGNMNEHETVMTDINNLDPHVLRWPGGNLSNVYFWNLSSNQRPDDIPEDISPWYGQNDDNWQMSNDDYYDLLENTNSTGIICVNYSYARYGTGPDPVAKAAHMAAEWVRYDKGRSKFWEIGNENFGSWQSGYEIDVSQNQDGQPRYISGQLYGQHCKVFIDSMRAAAAETGAEIKIGIVAYDAETSWDPIQTVWNEGMMPEVGDLADFLIVHQYFTPYDENSTVSTILNSHPLPGEIMSVMVSDMAEAGKPMIPVAFTEWNIFAVGSMQQVSYINGIHAALVLGEFIQNDYGLSTRWDLTNGWADGDDHGMFSRGGEPGVDDYNPRPVFFYMYYFQKYFGDRMVHSSLTGNSKVIAYASSFTSGEAGMVIINKSTSDETVLIEIDNFEPGKQYYYHTLTGGTDNGDFSRKVFLNGYGTDEEGGGPDEYESIKAFASEVEGGIKVSLPHLSVVCLMVDKKPPSSYLFSKIDVNAAVISVEFSDPVLLSEDPSGFEVFVNDSVPHSISRVEVDSTHANLIYIYLDQEVLPADRISLSYSGNDILSQDSVEVSPFLDELVENLLPGAVPQLRDAFTTSDGSMIHLVFNMGLQVSDSSIESFILRAKNYPDLSIELAELSVDEEDSTTILISPAESLFAEYELVLSYSGTGVMSKDSALMEAFDSLPLINQAPGLPPELVSAEVSDYGFSINILFDKPLNYLAEFDTLFTIKVNDEVYTEVTYLLSSSEMIISLVDYIRHADTVTLSYEGTAVTSLDRGKLPSFENLQVVNVLPEPTVFAIPGIIDAELFTINIGMVLESCSDVGGGENLGYIDPGDWVEYEVNVSETGYYKGNLRVAAASNTGQVIIQTPDDDIFNQATVTTLVTGGWQVWRSVPVEIILHEGPQRLRLFAQTANYNINWLDLEFDRTLLANVVSAMTNKGGDTIEIVFDRDLAKPAYDEESGYSVQADGRSINVNRVTLRYDLRTTLVLVLDTALSADDDNITVSYESGTLMATDNRPVPFFTDMQVSNNVTTNVESMRGFNFSFYPNPARESITIESSDRKINGVEVTDITGKLILSREMQSPQETVKLDLNAPPGVYLLKIKSGNNTYCSKLIMNGKE